MGKANLAQEKRIMLFEEVYGAWTERRLTQEEAAELLGVCPRTFRRWSERYGEDGIDGLRDRRLSGASHRAAPVDEVMRMVDRYRTRHEGWSVRRFYSWYRRDGGKRSYGWVKNKLQEAGGKVDKGSLTQFGRAMAQLGVEMVPAYSPEARGRSERAFGTHQGRLPKELALAGVTDLESANRYLAEACMPAFNEEFAQPAREPGSAFVPCRDLAALDDVLCEVHERAAGRDNCVHFKGLALQLPADRHRAHYMKARVKVRRHADGTLSVWHGPRRLAKYASTGEPLADGELAAAA